MESALAIDGNWISDVEGRAEILWSEDFTNWGVGEIEFRHLRNASGPGSTVHEWFAHPSLNDPVAKLIVPAIRRQFRILYSNEIMERVAEARAELAGTNAYERREGDQ